jgi:hypothetical protein
MKERLKQFGLEPYFEIDDNKEYQRKMACRLREITFSYLQGTLTDVDGNPIPDGPVVTQIRQNIHIIKGLDHFVRTQSPNGAWGTDLEYTLLTELLKLNAGVRFAPTGEMAILSPDPTLEQPTIVLINTNNKKWDAQVNGQKDTETVHEGNCLYTSVARAVQALVQPEKFPLPAPSQSLTRYLEEENEFFKRRIEKYQQENKAYEEKYKGFTDEVKDQIAADRRYAMRLALADLPGVAGRPSRNEVNPYGLFGAKGPVATSCRPNPIFAPHPASVIPVGA